MERCQTESLGHLPDQQQHQQQYQQQTSDEEQRCPFLSPTTPAWGDRNVGEQSTEETNNNFSISFVHSVPSTSDSRISTTSIDRYRSIENLSRNSSSSSIRSSTENNQSSIDPTRLPRKCRLCFYVAGDRTEYIDHIITHCTFTKSSYIENDRLNGYVDDEEYDDSGNESHSKGKKRPKIPRPKSCNKCEFVAKTKSVLWLHLRQHFKQEECSGFVCTLCPFATTLKHHMTFHWFSAHDDFKGFTCTECRYTCVSKSMLTSHMKTHSEVYQYHCASCTYKTKFCNAMKKHLKDNLHVAGMVLNPDGTPNPFATIDVYGSKRGPRRRTYVEEKKEPCEIEDRPSISGLIPLASTVSTSSTSVSSSPISSAAISDSPDSKMTLMSPIRTSSPSKISPTSSTPVPSSRSNSFITDVLSTFNRMNNENGVNPGINPSPNEQIPTALSNPTFTTLCHLLINDMGARRDLDDEECQRVFRLLRNIQRFLLGPEIWCQNGNGDLADNGKTVDESSISMATDELSTIATPASESQPRVEERNGVPDEPLDLSMTAMSRKTENQPQFRESAASTSSRRSKRKRKATKLEYPMTNENTTDNGTQQTWNTNRTHTEPSLPALLTASQSDLQRRNETLNVTHNANIYNSSFICYHCHIIFANEIMYTVHMSFHSTKNPLMCALCDRKSANVVAFYLHLIRTKH